MRKFYDAFLENLKSIKDNKRINLPLRILIVLFFAIVPFSVTAGAIILFLKSVIDSKK